MPPKKKKKKKKSGKPKKKITEFAEVVRSIELAAAMGNINELITKLDPLGGPKLRKYNPKGKAGNALVKACQHGQLQCAEKLLEFGFPVDWGSGKPIQVACRSNQINMVKWLIKRNADVNSKAEFTELSPLMYAAKERNLDLVALLLAKGAKLNQKCHPRNCGFNNGWAALHYAADAGTLNVCELLLNARASLDLPTADGDTALGIAAEAGRMELVEWLVTNGASINITRRGMNATQWAIYRAEYKTTQFLVSYGGLPSLNSTVLWFVPQQTLGQCIKSEFDPKIVELIDLAIYRGRLSLRQRSGVIRQLNQIEWEVPATYDENSVDIGPSFEIISFDPKAVQLITQYLEAYAPIEDHEDDDELSDIDDL